MTCQDVVELVTAYLEGALTPDESARFEEHVDACAGCATYLRQIRATIDLLGEVPEQSLAPRTRQALLDAFDGWQRS